MLPNSVSVFVNTLVHMAACETNITCIAQVTFKFVNKALLVHNWRLSFSLFKILCAVRYRSEVWKASTEWVYQYLNSWCSQYTANWTAFIRERKIKLLCSYLTPVMKTCWRISVKKRAFLFVMHQTFGIELHRADSWGTCK